MLDINNVVVGETKVRIISLPKYVRQMVGDIGTVENIENQCHEWLPLAVNFGDNQRGGSNAQGYWWFSPEHLEIVEYDVNVESVVKYNIGDKFRVVNLDGDLNLSKCGVKVGDVGEVLAVTGSERVWLCNENWIGEEGYSSKEVYFNKSNVEPFVEITESRWEEIIESMDFGYDLTDEQVTLVKSVLKSNVPSSVVTDKLDPVISKEVQTHLDANYIGDDSNCVLYYKSDVLKKWFYWNEYCFWVECGFAYEDDSNLFPISIMLNKTKES